MGINCLFQGWLHVCCLPALVSTLPPKRNCTTDTKTKLLIWWLGVSVVPCSYLYGEIEGLERWITSTKITLWIYCSYNLIFWGLMVSNNNDTRSSSSSRLYKRRFCKSSPPLKVLVLMLSPFPVLPAFSRKHCLQMA